MAIQIVKVGAAVNDGTGDDARTCFTKINQNFTDTTHAASRLVGTTNGQVPLAEDTYAAAYTKIDFYHHSAANIDANTLAHGTRGLIDIANPNTPPMGSGDGFCYLETIFNYHSTTKLQRAWGYQTGALWVRIQKVDGTWSAWNSHWNKANTTVDANGFIKRASPIVKLFADKIECNDEANLQPVTFEKLGVGDYLIKGSTGFAQDGWYIEMPKDANGNVLVSVIYEQLENNDISVKTYAKMFDEETGDIVANTAKPRDIPSTRWIDLRLQALPQDDTQPLDIDETVNTNAE